MNIKEYLNQVENSIVFYPISSETWETVVDRDLPEEMNALTRKSWYEAELKLSEEDKEGLLNLDPAIVDKFTDFSSELKSSFNMTMVDFIDYDSGKVIIARANRS